MSETRLPPLRAVLRTAATWGAAWAAAGGAVVAVLALLDSSPAIDSLPERLGLAAFATVAWGVRFGLAGAVVGTAFALAVRFGYRGRRLADIRPLRFSALGALVGGVGVPLYLQTMNVLSGDGPVAWNLISGDAVLASVLGAVVAAGSILVARRAGGPPHEPGADGLARPRAVDALPAARWQGTAGRERARAARD